MDDSDPFDAGEAFLQGFENLLKDQYAGDTKLCSGPASIGKNLGLSYGMGGLVLAVDFAL